MTNPARWRIVAIGKIRKPWIQDGLNLYLKRLPRLAITELRDCGAKKESEAIRKTIASNELPITLSEEGESLTSFAFSQRLQRVGAKRLAFIIGGADGLSPDVKKLAYWNLSLSPLTFPHDIARLLLVEQLYRATTISQGSPYHRE